MNKNVDKYYQLKLKNRVVVEITKQDIINNNLSKLQDTIPELKLTHKISDTNPFKKIIQKLERGDQNKFLYYKVLSYIFFSFLCLIQIYETVHYNSRTLPMFFITIWGAFLTIL